MGVFCRGGRGDWTDVGEWAEDSEGGENGLWRVRVGMIERVGLVN